MAVYRVTDTQLTTVADAIRQKGGTQGPLTFPGGFAQAVGQLPGVRPFIEYAVNAAGDITRAKLYGFTTIPDSFFKDQTALEEVDLSQSPNITAIGARAFSTCARLVSATLPPAVTTIGERAFEGCAKLELTALPAGITSIGPRAFTSCSNLAVTALPPGLTVLPDNVFQSCRKLAISTLPAQVTSIGTNAFSNCSAMTVEKIPATVVEIGNGAFSGCSGLVNLEIAASVLGTGTRIFQACGGLEKVWLRSSCETITAGSGTYSPFLSCPAGLLFFAEPTAKPTGWGSFFNRVATGGATEASVTWGQTTRPW